VSEETYWPNRGIYIGSPKLEPQARGLVSVGEPIIVEDLVFYDEDICRNYIELRKEQLRRAIIEGVSCKDYQNYEYYLECESGIRK